MGSNPRSLLSPGQIAQKVYDEVNDRIRVDAQYTSTLAGELEIAIDSTEDSVTIGDTAGNHTTTTTVGPDTGLDVNIIGGTVTVSGTTTANQGSPNTVANSWPTKITDGTDTALVTAAGELNVLATAQPGVDIGDVTVNNAAGASAVNIQDGGNSITVDGTVAATQSGTWNINNVSGTVSLPTGAATEATLSSLNTNTTNGSQKTQIVDGSGNVVGPEQTVAGTNYLPVVLAASATPGSAVVARSIQVAGTDGTNARTLSTDTTGKINVNNISGTISLPTGAATAANQTTANTSLTSIDSKLTSPLSVTQTQYANSWYATGEVSTAATTNVQVMKTGFTYTGSNTTPFIASGSTNDTLAGTGAQKITFTYFKQDGSGPFTQTENMNGTTGFFSAATQVAFIQSVVVSQVGSGGSNAGAINVANLSPLSTMANIAIGDNETYYSHHFVPLGKTAYFTEAHFSGTSTTAGRSVRFFLKKQTIPLTSNPIVNAIGTLRFEGTSSTDQVIFPAPVKIVGPAVIFATVTPDSATADTWTFGLSGYDL